ncbi:MAG: VWA domain-containing protein [Candidatus Acidiferrales bacterium]|jgi:Ca-activated chloride channel family protein
MNPKKSAAIGYLRVAMAILIGIGVVLSAASPRAGDSRLQEKGAAPIRVESSFVLVEATVKDESGKIVDGLTADDFRVKDDGLPQTVAYFSRDELPLAVALVVDVSESIVRYFEELTDSMAAVLPKLKPEDQVALFTFSNTVEKRADLNTDKGAVAERLGGLTLGGSTNLNDAIYEAARYLGERAPAMRRVIILVSDNIPSQEGKYSPKEVENEILKADAALYSLKIPGENSFGVQLYIEQAEGRLVNVGRLVAHTGGEVIEVNKERALGPAFATIIQRLKARYTLGYTPIGHALQDGRYHSVGVVMAGERCKKCRVEAKRGYFGTRPPGAEK